MLIHYLSQLDSRHKLLWSAFIWYSVLIGRHDVFIPEPWFKAAGIAMVVGLADLGRKCHSYRQNMARPRLLAPDPMFYDSLLCLKFLDGNAPY
jgi:hypothetical protein